MREAVQLRNFENIITSYSQEKPFAKHLADFFKLNKQMGSKDRKLASQLCYNYFRVSHAISKSNLQERLAISCFICDNECYPLLDHLLKEYTKLGTSQLGLPIEKKLEIVEKHYPDFRKEDIFPFSYLLSDDIDKEQFLIGNLSQPWLWIRVKKDFLNQVTEELKIKDIPFVQDDEFPNCFSLKNSSPIDQLEAFKKGYFEIQDRSSQITSSYFKPGFREYWWDCCAASGGKSLALKDTEPSINLTVSDIRTSVLNNLKERFLRNRIRDYTLLNIDLLDTNQPALTKKEFDGIIADVPCSGSGTWARSPEMFNQFKESSIKEFQHLQLSIIKNVLPYLKPGKALIYITCSVFKLENEDVINILTKTYNLKVDFSGVIKGYRKAADTMFVARLVKEY